MSAQMLDLPHAEVLTARSTIAALKAARIRAVLWLTLIFWGSNYLVFTIATALSQNDRLAQLTVMRLMTMLLGLLFCFLIHLLLTRPGLATTRKRLIALAIVAPIAAETFAWATFFAEALADPRVTLAGFSWAGAIRTIAFWTWFFLAWAGLYLALSYSFDVREEQQEKAEIREQAHTAQLRALHSQINPHFLFNSLNSLSALILDRNIEGAEKMVSKLAHFLRLGLAADPKEKIRLAAEIEFQRTYLQLEQLRYEDLEVRVCVPENLSSALVPALILQPIVENAVKYGVAGSPPPARIDVQAWPDARRLILQVTDSGRPKLPQAEGSGIGLSNIGQRLRLVYGEGQADLIAGRLEEGGFRVRLSLPLEFA